MEMREKIAVELSWWKSDAEMGDCVMEAERICALFAEDRRDLVKALDEERNWFETEQVELSRIAKEYDEDGNHASRDRCLYNAMVSGRRAAGIRAALAKEGVGG